MAIVNRTETRNFTAQSSINSNAVMYMNSSYNSESGQLTFGESIQNMTLYKANKAAVDADYDEWKAEIEAEVLGE